MRLASLCSSHLRLVKGNLMGGLGGSLIDETGLYCGDVLTVTGELKRGEVRTVTGELKLVAKL